MVCYFVFHGWRLLQSTSKRCSRQYLFMFHHSRPKHSSEGPGAPGESEVMESWRERLSVLWSGAAATRQAGRQAGREQWADAADTRGRERGSGSDSPTRSLTGGCFPSREQHQKL